tara:strand:+ start:2101 stop:2520 length:420 start_codon:yes stop_codon:yes gene_type:complete
MAGTLNKVMLIGNLGKDPELKTFEGGNSLARFPIATSETYTNKQSNERVTQTEWHSIVLRRGLAEVAEKYLKKGDKVYIEGKIKTRSWEDDRGEKRYSTEIQADSMTMLSGRREENSNPSPSPAKNVELEKDEDDDLPF